MDISILVARLFGALLLAFVAGLLLNKKYYSTELPKLLENKGFLMMGGSLDIVLGLLLVTFHNFWVSDWTVIITILGWAALCEGVWLLVFPKTVPFFKPLLKPANFYTFLLPFYAVLGVVLTYYGFFA